LPFTMKNVVRFLPPAKISSEEDYEIMG